MVIYVLLLKEKKKLKSGIYKYNKMKYDITIFLSGLREASEIVLFIEEIGAVLKQDERSVRHFCGGMTSRIIGNQTDISIFLQSKVISLFHRAIFRNGSCWKDILHFFSNQKMEAVCQ